MHVSLHFLTLNQDFKVTSLSENKESKKPLGETKKKQTNKHHSPNIWYTLFFNKFLQAGRSRGAVSLSKVKSEAEGGEKSLSSFPSCFQLAPPFPTNSLQLIAFRSITSFLTGCLVVIVLFGDDQTLQCFSDLSSGLDFLTEMD